MPRSEASARRAIVGAVFAPSSMALKTSPPNQATVRLGRQVIGVGETYDFEYEPTVPEELVLEAARGGANGTVTSMLVRIVRQRMSIAIGTRLGAYEIVAPIGAGGMGEVYRARDTRLHRDVAVKILPAAVASDPDRLRRFAQEARTTAALNHPNICTIHDIDETASVPSL